MVALLRDAAIRLEQIARRHRRCQQARDTDTLTRSSRSGPESQADHSLASADRD